MKKSEILEILGIESKGYDHIIPQFRELAKRHDPNAIWLKGDYGIACQGKIVEKTADLIVVE